MPTYEYACTSCGHRFDAVQSFNDPALTVCPKCDGPLRKVFGSVGIVLKGSGFYKTDSRSGSNGAKSSTKESGTKETKESSGDSGSKETTTSSSSTKEASSSTSSEKAAAPAP